MGHFSDFLAIFQYNFGDSWDIHAMRPIILGYFSNNYDVNKYISFQDLHDPRGVIFHTFCLSICFSASHRRSTFLDWGVILKSMRKIRVFIYNFSCYVCMTFTVLCLCCHHTSNKQNNQLRVETKARKIKTKVIYKDHHNTISTLRHLYRTCWTVPNDNDNLKESSVFTFALGSIPQIKTSDVIN